MTISSQVLIITPDGQTPQSLENALNDLQVKFQSCSCQEVIVENQTFFAPEAAVLARIEEIEDSDMKELTEKLDKLAVETMILADQTGQEGPTGNKQGFLVKQSESPEMLKGRLAMMLEMAPKLKRLSAELKHANFARQPLDSFFNAVDEEMRLAGRLQRDFLPRTLPETPGYKFASIFRPATWVSGDIYELGRLDENNIGFWLADVVGHGMPAALLSIFVKQALVTKKISGHSYELVAPGAALAELNQQMIQQDLSNFQFATCCCGILNTKTRQLKVASAGHPAPMRINKNGQTSELEVSGTLLGVFPDPEYQTETIQLDPGDKLLIYSDGVELAFVNEGPDEPLRFRQEFSDLGHLPIQQMCEKLLQIIDSEEGSLHPRDDVTIIGIEIDQ